MNVLGMSLTNFFLTQLIMIILSCLPVFLPCLIFYSFHDVWTVSYGACYSNESPQYLLKWRMSWSSSQQVTCGYYNLYIALLCLSVKSKSLVLDLVLQYGILILLKDNLSNLFKQSKLKKSLGQNGQSQN